MAFWGHVNFSDRSFVAIILIEATLCNYLLGGHIKSDHIEVVHEA